MVGLAALAGLGLAGPASAVPVSISRLRWRTGSDSSRWPRNASTW